MDTTNSIIKKNETKQFKRINCVYYIFYKPGVSNFAVVRDQGPNEASKKLLCQFLKEHRYDFIYSKYNKSFLL